MDPTTEPTTYTNPVARFPVGSESDPDSVLLARLLHARTTCAGVTYLSLTDLERANLRSGAAHIVNAVCEALRDKLGASTHAIIRAALEESFLDGDCAAILRHAEDDLDRAIIDDAEHRARVAARMTSDGTAPPSELLPPGAKKVAEGDDTD